MIRQRLGVLSAVMLLLIGSAPSASQSSNTAPGRLGVKGSMGFLVTAVDRAQKSAIRPGDVIISVKEPCTLVNVDELAGRLNAVRTGELVPVTVLRYVRPLKSFEKLEVQVKAISSSFSDFSGFGLKTRPGIVVNEIDAATSQSGIRPRDIIVSTELNGSILNVSDLQTEVRRSKVGSAVQTSILRYNSTKNRFDATVTQLRIYSFPNTALHHSRLNATNCPLGACQWCCNVCFANTCMLSACETSQQCVGKCIMTLCI